MYTTTNRRSGTAKIQRLQRELEVLEENIKSSLPSVALIKEPIQARTDDTNKASTTHHQAPCSDFIPLWLFPLGELATLLTHRLAFTFGS
jgi:hypothetical protein